MIQLKNLILGIAIALLFAFTVGYGINAFYPSPQYDDFCKSAEFSRPVKIDVGAVYRNCTDTYYLYDQCYQQNLFPIPSYNENGCVVSIECSTCQKDYDASQASYSRKVFIIAGIAGIIAIITGALIPFAVPISSGLMGGGLLSILYGNIVQWRNFDNVMRFIILFAWLVIVLGLAYWINKRKKTKKKIMKRK